jgi:hypothetical protein
MKVSLAVEAALMWVSPTHCDLLKFLGFSVGSRDNIFILSDIFNSGGSIVINFVKMSSYFKIIK